MSIKKLLLVAALSVAAKAALGQSLSLAEATATGAKPMTATEVKDLVSGAKTEFNLVSGALRLWTNAPDGTLIASRSNGDVNRRTGRGTWSVNDDAAYCLTFDWGAMESESWCRQLYKVEDRYYAYNLNAKPDTKSGRYRFSR